MCLGIPGEITEIHGEEMLTRTAKVRFGGIYKEVYLAYTPEARQGDFVIVHVGFAISIIDKQEAEKILNIIEDLP
ncbi:MAG: HypC/HybG/HupF family hydrogenase formation chaperone [Pseudobdellovibrionaceae bacterium]